MANKSESDSGSKRKGPKANAPTGKMQDRILLSAGTPKAPARPKVHLPKPARARRGWVEPSLSQTLVFFYRSLHTMMNAGIPLIKAVQMLAAQCERADLGNALQAVSMAVERGQYLSEAMRMHPTVFPALHPPLVRIGERSGSLIQVLSRLSDSLERDQEVSRRLKSALTYPLMICGSAVLFVLAVPALIFPSLLSFFQGLRVPIPWYTQTMLGFLKVASSPLMWVGGLLLVAALAWSWRRYPQAWSQRLDSLPILGPLRRRRAAAEICRNLSLMYGVGVPILQALQLVSECAVGQLRESLRQTSELVRDGQSLHQAMRQSCEMPPVLLHLLAAGEEAGQTSQMLEKGARLVEETLDEKISAALAALQPLILALVGAWVGLLVLSVMGPMVDVVSQL